MTTELMRAVDDRSAAAKASGALRPMQTEQAEVFDAGLRFAQADDVIRGADRHDAQGLALHRSHRQHMRANGRKVDQAGFNRRYCEHGSIAS